MGPDGAYTIFQLDGRDAAACYQLGPHMPGVPPHWALYIAVDSADRTVSHAAALGATVLRPAFDVSTFGRMAVIQDPTGAGFASGRPGQTRGSALPAFLARSAGLT